MSLPGAFGTAAPYHRRAVSPTVLRQGPYRFHFFAGDRVEPPHIHVEGDDGEAKFWLRPVSLADSRGYSDRQTRVINVLSKHIVTTSSKPGESSSAPDPVLANPRRVVQEPTPVVDVRFAHDRVYFLLQDGREIGAPLAQFPRLVSATQEQRQHWRKIGRGFGVNWPDVDEDIHVAHLLGLSD